MRSLALNRLASAFVFTSALLALEAQAQVLVCIDSQGKKEYAASCPHGTVSQKEIRAKGASLQEAPGEARSSASSSWQDQERAFQQRRIERESAEAAQARKQKQQEHAERRCASLRRGMEQLQSGRRLRWVDRKAGERPVMTEEEHAAEMKRVEAELRQCRS